MCKKCFKTIDFSNENQCVVCGRPAKPDNRLCPLCGNEFFLDGVFVMGKYDGAIKELIRLLKFDYVEEAAADLSKLFVDAVVSSNISPSLFDQIIIPIPLYRKRFLERGFNQSELIARKVAEALHMNFRPDLLCRIKNTAHQANLTKSERFENIKEAFSAREGAAIEKVFLFDDVFTTGQTMNEAAKSLKAAGVKEVRALALAHGS